MMYKISNHYLIFIILSHLVIRVAYGQQFLPGPRTGQTATLLGDKIYYIGGKGFSPVDNDPTSSDFFYLGGADTWVDLKSQGVKLPLISGHTSGIGGVNQDSIFIIGGISGDINLVHQFDTKTNTLSVPVIQGKSPLRREMSSVSYGGKIYIFSGRLLNNNNQYIFFNNFDILDTVNLIWEIGNTVNAPLPMLRYTATLVNGVIYYIGGLHQGTGTTAIYTSMSSIYQYDIIGNTWSLKKATAIGTMPGTRGAHSAVLFDGKICVFGGRFRTTMPYQVPPVEPIALLDTTTLVWSIPTLSDPNIPKLAYHTATLIDKLMFVAFGNFTDVPIEVVNNNFYIFNLGDPNFQWFSLTAEQVANAKIFNNTQSPASSTNILKITPTSSPVTTSSNAKNANTVVDQQPQNKTLIIGLSAGIITMGLAGIVAFSLVYIRKRKKKNENFPSETQIPPGGNNNHYSTNHQQYSPVNQQFAQYQQYSNSQQNPHYSPTPTLTQSQGYHEFSTLSPPQQSQRSSNYSPGSEAPPSNYFPGSETLPSNYSPGSETVPYNYPPPPPPKTLQITSNIHGTDHQPFY